MIGPFETRKRQQILKELGLVIPNAYVESGSKVQGSRGPELIKLYFGLEKIPVTISPESDTFRSFYYYLSNESKMKTLKDIGSRFSISGVRAGQIIEREIERLRYYPKDTTRNKENNPEVKMPEQEWDVMTVSEVIKALQAILEKSGDLPVHIFDYSNDDSPIYNIHVKETGEDESYVIIG